MEEFISHNVTSRKRKSRALKRKRESAAEKDLTLIEGALVVIHGDLLNVLIWDDETQDYVAIHASRIVPL